MVNFEEQQKSYWALKFPCMNGFVLLLKGGYYAKMTVSMYLPTGEAVGGV